MRVPPRVPPVPAVLRLVQLAVLGRWREAGEELYRAVADVTGAAAGQDLLVAGCGDGVGAEWLATRTGASVIAVDADPERIERASRRLRASATRPSLSYQHSALDDLPHETAVFDVAVGETALAAAKDPARAVAELVRVTKPMGVVVLLQLTWGSELTADEQERVVERLGMRPYLLVEWKRMLRGAGVVDCQIQDWTPGKVASAIGLSWSEKVQIAGQAMRTAGGGWRSIRQAVDREIELLRELADERAIGFQLIKGVKWPHARPA
jgi:ubiquinone/menaquinone biosynthesis C-methylase UbiE